MSISFPSNPLNGATYVYNGKIWVYNGSTWSTNPTSQGLAAIVSPSAPATSSNGTEWFNSTNNTLNIYNNGVWYAAGGITVSGTAPSSPSVGAIWYDSTYKLFKTYNGSTWISSASSTDIAAFGFAF
jgi:hypothetical protein